MPNFRLTIQYDGTEYNGWQVQSNGRTIQGELTRILSLLDHHPVTVHGAGRTDAGVHAEGQVATVLMSKSFGEVELRDAINGNLDRDIRIKLVEAVTDSFNARLSAKEKTYRYRIWNGDVVSPFVHRYVYHHRGRLNLDQMNRAAEVLVGTHDFSAFTVAEPQVDNRIRSLNRLGIEFADEIISITAAANGFLRYMVRTIVGTLIEVGRGRMKASSVPEILAALDRAKAGPSAPAAGLTLLRVDY